MTWRERACVSVGRESQGARVEARGTSPVDRQLVRHLRRPVSHPSSSKPPSVSASLLPCSFEGRNKLTPGIEIRPTTLIWLSTGSSAVRRASAATGLHASKREAPCVRSTSTVSLCELCVPERAHQHEWGKVREKRRAPQHVLKHRQHVVAAQRHGGNGIAEHHAEQRHVARRLPPRRLAQDEARRQRGERHGGCGGGERGEG